MIVETDGESTYAPRLARVRRQAGVKQLGGNAVQRHATVQAHTHKLHNLLVAHYIPHPITRQHKESILCTQLHLHKQSLHSLAMISNQAVLSLQVDFPSAPVMACSHV